MNLDAATGTLRWYYQGVPDDFKDYDMQTSPIAARAGGVPVVIGSGKMGYVYEMNAHTGKLIWKSPVGEHNERDNDSRQALEHRSTLKAPFTILPGPLGGVLADLAVADNSVYVETLDVPVTYTDLNLRATSAGAAVASGEVERSASPPARSNGTGGSHSCRSARLRCPTISCSRRSTTVC